MKTKKGERQRVKKRQIKSKEQREKNKIKDKNGKLPIVETDQN